MAYRLTLRRYLPRGFPEPLQVGANRLCINDLALRCQQFNKYDVAVDYNDVGQQMHVVGPGVAVAERGRDFSLDTHGADPSARTA
jgi:hypothetical protein